mgnify:FL=1
MAQVIQFHPRAIATAHNKAVSLTALPPLALYVHVPWCVKKCPYCDFNSHELKQDLSDLNEAKKWETAYIDALLRDLESNLPDVWGRRLVSVYIGGGTPSVLSASAIDTLLAGIRARLPQVADIEVTMEANPGTLDTGKLEGFRDAGVTRLSLGVQSFNDTLLQRIGRIHNGRQAHDALETAYRLFDKVNLDIMFALPQQTMAELQADVAAAMAYAPTHLSYYHLTLEPNTFFHRHPPILPDDDLALDMQEHIEAELAHAGLHHYEVSAYAAKGHESLHNSNYWRFGDYIGIGAGAHGKISQHNRIFRQTRFKHPNMYLESMQKNGHAIESTSDISCDDLPFEFMLNALRLRDGASVAEFHAATGLTIADLEPALSAAQAKGLMEKQHDVLRVTDLGWRFLSDVQGMFLAGSKK